MSDTAGVLVLFAHPALEKSRVNRVLADAVRALPGVTFHDLYERYPDFHIDVRREQELLTGHDVVVFHHPMFWYSTPSILKEWQDLVLEHGWAYGSEGTALRGKTMFHVITTGGQESAYQTHGLAEATVADLLLPVAKTARLCGLDWLPPFVVHGTHGITREAVRDHAHDYRRLLEAFRDRRVNAGAARATVRMNEALDSVIRHPESV